jgi:hypothetical protein
LVKVVEDLGIDLGTAESNITGLGTSKENTANKATDFSVINDVKFPTTEAVDEFLTAEVPNADTTQFFKIGNTLKLATKFTEETTLDVSFITSSQYGSETLPVYYGLNVTRENGVNKNQSIVYHSSILKPLILTDPLVDPIGTKPTWLIITGDAYLTGLANLNELNFTFHKFYEGEKNIVTCEIQALSGANEDPNPDYPALIDMSFNEMVDPVLADSVLNNAFFDDFFVPTMLNPSEAFYENTIYGDCLVMGSTSNSAAVRAILEVDMDEVGRVLLENQKLTVIAKLALTSGGSYIRREVFSNENTGSGRGCSFSTGDTAGTLSWRTGNGSTFQNVNSPSSFTLLENGIPYCIAAVFSGINLGLDGADIDFYVQSTPNSIGFTDLGTVSTVNDRFIDGADIIQLNRRGVGSTLRPTKEFKRLVIADALTSSQIQEIFNLMETV